MMKTRETPLDQFVYHAIELEDDATEFLETVKPLIGEVVLQFNGLERELDSALCQTITERTDATGLLVLHRMAYKTKVDLFSRLMENLMAATDWSPDQFLPLV